MAFSTSDRAPEGVGNPRRQHRPPGPIGLPLLGNVLAFGKDHLGFFSAIAKQYGDFVSLNLAGWPALLVSDMAAIESVLVKDHGNFVKNRLTWRHVTTLFGSGLLTNEGESWQRQRRLAAPVFAGSQLLAHDKAVVALTNRTLNRWRSGQILDLHPEMMGLTLRIAAKTLFDSEIERDISDMDHALNDLMVEIASRFKRPIRIPDAVPLPGHIRYRRAIRTVERVVATMMAERRATGLADRTDFLSRLMAARDEEGKPMSDAMLRDEAITLLLAGHETIALAISWTWLLLCQNPEAERRMADEIAQVIGNRPATVDDIPRLKYTESVLMESMRIYPPAWAIGRESTTAFELGGYALLPGTTIFISPWVLHRDPRYFDEPERFRPERWMGSLSRELARFAYMPFGGGPRICIGQRFAMIEAILILTTIAQRFSADWQSDRPVTPFPSITLRPRGGVWLRIKDRRAAH